MGKQNWGTPLTRELETIDGVKFRTLADARAYIVAFERHRVERKHWERAMELLLEASETGDASAFTEQLDRALFFDMRLKLPPAPKRTGKNKIIS